MKITSAGIIRNEDKPRTGVVSGNSLNTWVFDEIDQGIDLAFEEFQDEQARRIAEIEADDTLTVEAKASAINEIERESDFFECDGGTVLFGDAWFKGPDGKYDIDRTKEYAATYSRDSDNVCVEWSKYTTRCHHTSPCYVMSDGSGPCGDLDSPGDSVIAYTLPPDSIGVN
jgi:hypothetical protein